MKIVTKENLVMGAKVCLHPECAWKAQQGSRPYGIIIGGPGLDNWCSVRWSPTIAGNYRIGEKLERAGRAGHILNDKVYDLYYYQEEPAKNPLKGHLITT